MFTGIIEETGVVESFTGGVLKVLCSRVLEDTAPGASVAVSGVCLTVTDTDGESFSADVSRETAAKTTLARVKPGSVVNLERAARLGQPVGGHLVQGHVDDIGTIKEINNGELRVRADPSTVVGYCVLKGSVAVDGISLTISGLDRESFRVSLIPYTVANTTLGRARPGDEVNLEVDIIAKYVKKFVAGESGSINEVFLAEHGYL